VRRCLVTKYRTTQRFTWDDVRGWILFGFLWVLVAFWGGSSTLDISNVCSEQWGKGGAWNVVNVDSMVADTFRELTSEELLSELDNLTIETTKLQATRLACMREADARNLCSDDGHLGTAPWLTFRYGACRKTVGSDLSLARKLVNMPATEQALRSGMITTDHARRLARARTRRTEERFDIDETQLVDNALRLSFKEFCTATRYWEQHADPDGSAQTTQEAIDDRRLSMSQVGDEWVIHGTSDELSGAQISEALHRIEQELFDTDWANAKQRVGDAVTLTDLERSYAQRSHDALLEMAIRATATKAGAKAPEPLVTIVMDYNTFMDEALRRAGFGFDKDLVRPDKISELVGGGPIDPAYAFEIALRGQISRIVMAGKSVILDAGTSTRFVTGALRRALIVRDTTCTWTGCEISSAHAEMDHIIAAEHGGHTSEQNCRPKCPGHHRHKHSGRFKIFTDNEDNQHIHRTDGTPIQPLHRAPPP